MPAVGQKLVHHADDGAQFVLLRGQGNRNIHQRKKRLGLNKAVLDEKAVGHALVDERIHRAAAQKRRRLLEIVHVGEAEIFPVHPPERRQMHGAVEKSQPGPALFRYFRKVLFAPLFENADRALRNGVGHGVNRAPGRGGYQIAGKIKGTVGQALEQIVPVMQLGHELHAEQRRQRVAQPVRVTHDLAPVVYKRLGGHERPVKKPVPPAFKRLYGRNLLFGDAGNVPVRLDDRASVVPARFFATTTRNRQQSQQYIEYGFLHVRRQKTPGARRRQTATARVFRVSP